MGHAAAARRRLDVLDTPVAHVRLSSCPRCGSRRRTLIDSGSTLVGRCLDCAETLTAPFEVEVLVRHRADPSALR